MKHWFWLFRHLIPSYVVDADDGGDRGDDFKPADESDIDVKSAADLAEEQAEKDEEVKDADKADGKDDKKEEKKDVRIPKKRFDEAVAKERAKVAEKDAMIQKLREESERNKVSEDIQAVRNKVDELDDKYEELLADGKLAEAKLVRKELRKLQDVLSNSVADLKASRSSAAAVEQVRFDTVVARVESDYPVLNPDHADYDQEETDAVNAMMRGLISTKGLNRADALSRAAAKVLGKVAKDDAAADAKGLRDTRKEDALKKGADALKKQPADIGKHGLDSDKGGDQSDTKVGIMKMNQTQFAKLDEEAKAKLRGDSL